MDIKIRLKVKDVEIEMDKKDAKELRDFLNDFFGAKVIKEREYIPYYPTYPRYRYNEITCDGTGDTRWTSNTGAVSVSYSMS